MSITTILSSLSLLLYLLVALTLYLPPRRAYHVPVWWLYCVLISPPAQFYYALWSPAHPIPMWIYPLGMIGRVAVTVEAIMLLWWVLPLEPYSQRRYRWLLSLGAGVCIWGLSAYTGMSMMGRVRIGCFVIVLATLAMWMWSYFKVFPFARRHFALMLVYLSTSAFASALGSVRGDWMDTAAILTQIVTLLGWCYLATASTSTYQRRNL